ASPTATSSAPIITRYLPSSFTTMFDAPGRRHHRANRSARRRALGMRLRGQIRGRASRQLRGGDGGRLVHRLDLLEALLDEGRVLDAGELRVEPIARQQFLVRAALDDLAVAQDKDLVRVPDGA